ncbi:MAG TPA: endonuclease domain-containing protein, partial [Actinomycetota bacterium]|nr:endonuclease domain-containing protein [Actinomycetota bacterium]
AARHVDHCHLSGKVRAVLCFNCNGGLGKTQERLDLLQHAADYLEGQHAI